MSVCVRDQQELNRVNVQMAWQFSHRMRAVEFEALCRVTIQQLHHEAGCPESCHARVGLDVA